MLGDLWVRVTSSIQLLRFSCLFGHVYLEEFLLIVQILPTCDLLQEGFSDHPTKGRFCYPSHSLFDCPIQDTLIPEIIIFLL